MYGGGELFFQSSQANEVIRLGGWVVMFLGCSGGLECCDDQLLKRARGIEEVIM